MSDEAQAADPEEEQRQAAIQAERELRAEEELLLLRARQANELKEHPLMKEALAALEEHFLATFRASNPEDAEGREACHRGLRAMDMFVAALTTHLNSGEVVVEARQLRTHQEEAQRRERDWEPE